MREEAEGNKKKYFSLPSKIRN